MPGRSVGCTCTSDGRQRGRLWLTGRGSFRRHRPSRQAGARRKPPRPETVDASLERQMADCGLSNDVRQFLRNLHVAEKQLNDAFRQAHQGGALEQRVSAVYRRMYGRD